MGSKGLSIKEKVSQFRAAIQDVMGEEDKLQSDIYLFYWLRAHEYNVKRSEKGIRENLKWRQENNIGELAKKELDPALEARFIYLLTKGTGGIPVPLNNFAVAFNSGAIDLAAILDDFGVKRLLLHVAQILAKQENLVHEFGEAWTGRIEDLPTEKSMIGCCMIYDADGYSIKQNLSMKVLQYMAEFSKMIINYFPAACHKVIIVNATKLVEIPLQIVKSIAAGCLDFDIHGKDEEDVTVLSHVLKPEELGELQAKAKEMLGGK